MRSLQRFALYCLLSLSCLVAKGGNISYPLAQEEINGFEDYGSGAGQSFLLPSGATIYAIELHIEYGDGSVEVNLWKTHRTQSVFERYEDTPEASGVLLKESVIGMPAGWFRVMLDQPYTNESLYAEELVFDLKLLTSGRDGWNDYSFSSLDPYTLGSRVYWSDGAGEYSESSDVDLAFRIITDNSPPAVFSFYDDGYGIIIDGYLGTDPHVVIPAELDSRPVRSVGRSIFHDATVQISSVSIPASVWSIELGAFELCCNELNTISVDSSNPYYTSQNGVLFNKEMTTLIRCPDAKAGTYVIPSSVTNIFSEAFRYCTQLTAIQIPESVTLIGNSAFESCSRLATLNLPSGLESIGASAFRSSGLTSITIPASLHRIKTRAFQDCKSLVTVVIEEGVEEMSSLVFNGCEKLERLTIPSSIVTIGALSFENCSNLKALYFESSAPDLVNTVFGGNPSGFGIYYAVGQTGYSGQDWDSLPLYPYMGPKPSSGYSHWLARQQMHTETADVGTMPSSEYSYFFGYALNLDLTQNIETQLPAVELTGNEMSITFYADGENVIYNAKASVDLIDWETIPVSISAPSVFGESTATVNITGYKECFIKLEIEQSEPIEN